MNTIPDGSAMFQGPKESLEDRQGPSWARVGFKKGPVTNFPSSGMQPKTMASPWFEGKHPSPSNSAEDDELSDWEREVNANGDLFYVVPMPSKDDSVAHVKSMGRDMKPIGTKSRNPGGKLSRLVRRRESKRDRGQHPSQHRTQKFKNGCQASTGQNYESSDNDSSSTYGQIKTFETLFEGSPIAKPLLTLKNEAQKVIDADDNSSSASSGGEMTEIHEIFVKFNAKQFKSQVQHFQQVIENKRNNGLLLETLLGIVPERRQISEEKSSVLDMSIFIAGVLAESPATRGTSDLHPGDILRSVDGYHATLDNINIFLLQKLSSNSHSTSCKVKLIIQRPKHKHKILASSNTIIPSTFVSDANQSKSDFLNILTDPPLDNKEIISRLPHFALFVTRQQMSDASSQDSADILYQYPDAQTDFNQDVLVKVRGIFMTLNQLVADMNAGGMDRVSVSSLMLGQGRAPTDLIHVAYIGEGENLFLFGAPACKVPSHSMNRITSDVVRFLRLKHGTLFDALAMKGREISTDPNKLELQRFFQNIFQELLLDDNITSTTSINHQNLQDALLQTKFDFERDSGCIQWLRLPDEVKFQVEDALNQLECADFQDHSDDFYELPREFHILGSGVFHKGLLIASHLNSEQLKDSVLWCRMNGLLKLTRDRSLHRLVVWQEIFLHSQSILHSATNDDDERHFVLVVGRDHQLLMVLLQTGGCTSQPKGPVRPDPFYVEQAMNSLDHLHEMGIPLVCNKWLILPPNPSILNVDHLYLQSDKKRDKQNDSNLPNAGIILCRTKMTFQDSVGSLSDESSSEHNQSYSDMSEELQTAFREEIEETNDPSKDKKDVSLGKKSSSYVGEDDGSVWRLQRSHVSISDAKSKGSNSGTSYTPSTEESQADVEQLVTYKVSQLTLSPENTIFHYIHLDMGEGVFLAPLAQLGSPYHTEIINQFRIACHIIHANFQTTLHCRDSMMQGSASKAWLNRNLIAVREQAMLFHWKPESLVGSKQTPVLSYWVCGRLSGAPGSTTESYVAYHESAPQITVELAFRLAHGVLL